MATERTKTIGTKKPQRARKLSQQDLLQKRRASQLENYFLRRQRKTFLETCRRIAVVGISPHPDSASYVATEKLLGLGVEILPVIPGRREFLAMPCYARLGDIAGEIDIVQVYPGKKIPMTELAREAVEKSARAFWIEEGDADPGVRKILAGGGVQVVEHEGLATEYIKHVPSPASTSGASTIGARSVTVGDRMTRNPVTVKPSDTLKEALDKMKKGRFRHLPVVDEEGKLIGMISDRDIRLIRPSVAFVSSEDAAAQLWSIAVRQAAVFNPVTIPPDASPEQAAELMLRWEVGGLPVATGGEKLVGIITYADLLREFVARGR